MKPLKLLNDLITAVAGLTLGFMTIMVMLQVFYRYVLEAPFPESQEIAVYAMVWVVMLGSTIAVYKKSHIAVNILVDRLSPNAAFAVRLVVAECCFRGTSGCIYSSSSVFLFAYQRGLGADHAIDAADVSLYRHSCWVCHGQCSVFISCFSPLCD